MPGGRAIAVPGDMYGYYMAWKKYGRLPWKELVQPAIDLAKDGFKVGIPLHETAVELEKRIRRDPGLRFGDCALFFNIKAKQSHGQMFEKTAREKSGPPLTKPSAWGIGIQAAGWLAGWIDAWMNGWMVDGIVRLTDKEVDRQTYTDR